MVRPHLLAPNKAQTAKNIDLSEGSLRSLYAGASERALGAATAWRYLSKIPANSGSDFWYLSIYSDADVCLSPTSAATSAQAGRFYATDGSRSKKSDWTLASTSGAVDEGAPAIAYYTGVPAPSATLTQTKQNTDATADLLYAGVSYVYTNVTEWGEESTIYGASANQDVNETEDFRLSGFTDPTTYQGPYNLIGIKLYRISSGNVGSDYQVITGLNDSTYSTYIEFGARVVGTCTTSISVATDGAVTGVGTTFSADGITTDSYIRLNGWWFKVTSGAVAATTMTVTPAPGVVVANTAFEFIIAPWIEATDLQDDVSGAEIIHQDQLGGVLPSATWTEPEADLEGLSLLSNNCMAAFKDNEVYLSAPSYPYTYPSAYQVLTANTIVGIGSFDTTLLVTTTKYPHIIECYNPLNLSKKIVRKGYPCLWKGSIVSDDKFVIFASTDGLMFFSSTGFTRLTAPIYSRKQWKALLTSSTEFDREFRACIYDNKYYAFYIGESEGFYLDLETKDIRTFDLGTSGGNSINVYDVHVDEETDNLFMLVKIDTAYHVYEWEGAATYLTYTWKSKEFRTQVDVPFSYYRLTGNFTSGVNVKAWSDGTQELSITIKDEDVHQFDYAPGKKFEYQVSGAEEVYTITWATTPQELFR